MNNGDRVRALYDDFATGNVPGVLGAFDEKIEWIEAEGFMYGGTYVGPTAILENVFMKLGTEWDGFSVVPHQIVDGGATVVAMGTYSGKFIETGKSMSVPFAHAWTFTDGRVVKFVQYTDTLVIARSIA